MSGFGMPIILSFFAPFIIRRFNVNNASKKQDEELLKKHTPVFVIISSVKDDPKSWIRTGQIYERIALMAEKENIKTAPMAAAIQIGEYYKELQKCAGITTRPQMFFRMGYCDIPAPQSPRLEQEDVISYT
jgi:hypothetical protein